MPDEAYWDSFFQPEGILDRLLVTQGGCYNLVEFGCGYVWRRRQCIVRLRETDALGDIACRQGQFTR